MEENYVIGAAQIFTLFFIMLGPLKMLGPFAKASQALPPQKLKKLSWQAVGIAAIAVLLGGFLGRGLLKSWGIGIPILELTSGLIFAFVAFGLILKPHKSEVAGPLEAPNLQAPNVAFSMIVTPYGVAVLITLLTMSMSAQRTLLILGILGLVLILNLLAMIFIREVMGKIGALTMQLLGTVLSVLQAALAIQIIYVAISSLKAG
ncbi:hypothetical protein D3C87_145930 [compost metagenome]